ncbi:uncharacterized protein A1O9_10993 [Exophiala aquamarina CBS 119918]|uniref:DUF1330 domain-containing protein n=1 Tax=Exophiala aquamarina CBS 119918 TaxID=1182545 RepID=A0A072PBW9_9EURO|nr:uncharacterized protein A1O9_10993 [Exophiala aquamarina CBS 119918]KEF53085.1 hypothetical protein A1O9_10993 [Exophiala aquamarina CBS 119918]
MSTTEIHLIDLSVAEKSIPSGVPVVMINLIKFKPQTTYPAGSPFTQVSGEEAYTTRYVTAFMKFVASVSEEGSEPLMKPLWFGVPQANLVAKPHGGNETWDRVGIIWYPNFETFRRWVDSKEYADGPLHHRLASLEDYRLYASTA